MKRKQQHDHDTPPNMEQIYLDLQSDDEAARARAVRALCPCHGTWQPFEQNMQTVAAMQKDVSLLVRGVANHVFEDAAQMECGGYPTNPRELTNEMLRARRASRFALEPEEITRKAHTKRQRRSKRGT